MLVYLDSKDCDASSYWAADVSPVCKSAVHEREVDRRSSFVELRTLMAAMGELAIAGRGKALLEWHNTKRFCGYCGTRAAPINLGRCKLCTNELCKRRVYSRVDPVVIMLVIDEEHNRVLLSRQSRDAPRRWTCLAGFIEPGESLQEAVRRETWEETGIEVDKVVYHSSRPWPVICAELSKQPFYVCLLFVYSREIQDTKQNKKMAVATSSYSRLVDPSQVVKLSQNTRAFINKGFVSNKECSHLISLAHWKHERSMVDCQGESYKSSSGMFLQSGQWTRMTLYQGLKIKWLSGHYFHKEEDPRTNNNSGTLCGTSSHLVKAVRGDALLVTLHPNMTDDKRGAYGSCPVLEGEKWFATKYIHTKPYSENQISLRLAADVCTDEEENCPVWAAHDR